MFETAFCLYPVEIETSNVTLAACELVRAVIDPDDDMSSESPFGHRIGYALFGVVCYECLRPRGHPWQLREAHPYPNRIESTGQAPT
jgi:hypothetical protein